MKRVASLFLTIFLVASASALDEMGSGKITKVILTGLAEHTSQPVVKSTVILANGKEVKAETIAEFVDVNPKQRVLENQDEPFTSSLDFYNKVLTKYCSQGTPMATLVIRYKTDGSNQTVYLPVTNNAIAAAYDARVTYRQADGVYRDVQVVCAVDDLTS